MKSAARRLYVVRWTIAGALFGLFFPLVAWRLAAAESGPMSFSELHQLHPTMWIVDLAPTVLGLSGAVIGMLFTRLADSVERTEAVARQIAAGWTAELHSANLELADALESRRQFHASVTHELRSPLTAIVGYTDLAGGVLPKPPELSGYLGEIYGAATAMLGMVNDLLDAAKLETGGIPVEITTAPCAEVIDAVVRRLRPLAQQKGLTVEVEAPPDVVCRADPVRLQQVLTNVVANAIKYSDSGTVRIHSRCEDDGTPIIEVHDEGAGIRPEDLDAIFGAFESGPNGARRSDSTGLGLAISRSLMEAMDGEISARSAGPGHGSTFTLKLRPATGGAAERRLASLSLSG